MADQLLFLTELLGLKVYDLKGRKLGVIKDAALVPLIDPVRIDRYLVGGGWTWLTIRMSTCCGWCGIFSTSRLSTARVIRSFESTTSRWNCIMRTTAISCGC